MAVVGPPITTPILRCLGKQDHQTPHAIIVNNTNTATGMIFFSAELHRNVFHHPEVDSVEFRFNGDCGAWSGLFESDGCRVITKADWKHDLAEWDKDRDQ